MISITPAGTLAPPMEPSKSPSISANRAFRRRSGPARSLLIAGFVLNATSALAAPTPGGPPVVALVPAGFSAPLPTDGAIGFSYSRAPAVTGCSQTTEAEMRDLLVATVHTDPFVPPGKTPTFRLHVEDTRPAPDLFRSTFSLFDEKGNPRGVSSVEDDSCDGVHLKLLASIALLLQPRPDAACDAACREAIAATAAERARRAVREKELPKAREEARAEAEKAFEERHRRDFRAVAGAGPAVGLNVAAQPALGYWLSAEARGERWSLGVEMRALLPARALDLGGAALDLASATGLVVPCLRWRWLGGCAVIEAGGVFVTGPAASAPTGLASAMLGLGLRARVDVPVTAGIEVRAFGDLLGYPAVLSAQGTTAGGESFSFDAPRRVAVVVGLGLARSFD